jgi:hypothetical protein
MEAGSASIVCPQPDRAGTPFDFHPVDENFIRWRTYGLLSCDLSCGVVDGNSSGKTISGNWFDGGNFGYAYCVGERVYTELFKIGY